MMRGWHKESDENMKAFIVVHSGHCETEKLLNKNSLNKTMSVRLLPARMRRAADK